MLTLREIVASLGGTLYGHENQVIQAIASLENAGPENISFLSNSRFRAQVESTRAGALILTAKDFKALQDKLAAHTAVIETTDPYLYYARLSQLLQARQRSAAHAAAPVHVSAIIDPTAKIAPGACIGAHVVVEADAVIGAGCHIDAGSVIGAGVQIGADTHILPRVTVYARSRIGQRCIIHSGVVIGADGFGFANDQGRWVKIAQLGRVVIGDDVEIGANTTIDRGALEDTVIEEGVKLDNQIQIGHNVHIGAHSALAGCVGVAGSARIGRHCMIGGAAMILGHLEIADRVIVSSGTLISRSINEAGMYTGIFPSQPNQDWEKTAAVLRQLPDLRQRLKALEKNFSAEKQDDIHE